MSHVFNANDLVYVEKLAGRVTDVVNGRYKVRFYGYTSVGPEEYKAEDLVSVHYFDRIKAPKNDPFKKALDSAKGVLRDKGEPWGAKANRQVGDGYNAHLNVTREFTANDDLARRKMEERKRAPYDKSSPAVHALTPRQAAIASKPSVGNGSNAQADASPQTATTPIRTHGKSKSRSAGLAQLATTTPIAASPTVPRATGNNATGGSQTPTSSRGVLKPVINSSSGLPSLVNVLGSNGLQGAAPQHSPLNSTPIGPQDQKEKDTDVATGATTQGNKKLGEKPLTSPDAEIKTAEIADDEDEELMGAGTARNSLKRKLDQDERQPEADEAGPSEEPAAKQSLLKGWSGAVWGGVSTRIAGLFSGLTGTKKE